MTTTLLPPATTQPIATPYPDDMLVRDARDAYLADNDLGDGGYDDAWVYVQFGWIPVAFPNVASRKKAIRAHDMHHVVTGCNGVWKEGEIDVAGYELASGGPGRFLFGWVLILSIFALGLFVRPLELFEIFWKTRGSKNMFGETVDESIYSLTVGELRARLGVDRAPAATWTYGDLAAFLGWQLLAHTLVTAFALTGLGLIGLIVWAIVN